MPHISIKMVPGKSAEQKKHLANEIVRNFVELFGQKEYEVSVATEEVDPANWKGEVFEPEIMNNQDKLYKKPGYTM